MNILKCPVCGKELQNGQRRLFCENSHSFDTAKEGYVNLLLSGKPGDSKGDNKEMARSRHDFLNKGFYSPLAQAVCDCAEKYSADGDTVLDICCGEGYYTEYLTKRLKRSFFGFDISKNMVRLAAKRKCGADFFVANIASIPLADKTVNFAFHLFAPFHEDEFSRVLTNNGTVITAIPGKNHLYGLKNVLYSKPYYNDEKPPNTSFLQLTDTIRVKSELRLCSPEDINALFRMTPYYYHTPADGMKKLETLETLKTETEFILLIYKKPRI